MASQQQQQEVQQPATTRWLVGIAVVIFDVDVGQRIDYLAPGPTVLTEDEQHAVAFHSFPDSMSMELHAKTSVRDTCFWFRVRRSSGQQGGAADERAGSATSQGAAGGSKAAAAAAAEPCLYGYVFCRQRQDESLRRGGEQVSVVVLSEHPFSSVLRPLSQVAGPMYFSHGPQALQQVVAEVGLWPAPTASGMLQLQVSFTTLSARLPPFDTLPHPSCALAVDLGPVALGRSSNLARSGSLASQGAGGGAQQAGGEGGAYAGMPGPTSGPLTAAQLHKHQASAGSGALPPLDLLGRNSGSLFPALAPPMVGSPGLSASGELFVGSWDRGAAGAAAGVVGTAGGLGASLSRLSLEGSGALADPAAAPGAGGSGGLQSLPSFGLQGATAAATASLGPHPPLPRLRSGNGRREGSSDGLLLLSAHSGTPGNPGTPALSQHHAQQAGSSSSLQLGTGSPLHGQAQHATVFNSAGAAPPSGPVAGAGSAFLLQPPSSQGQVHPHAPQGGSSAPQQPSLILQMLQQSQQQQSQQQQQVQLKMRSISRASLQSYDSLGSGHLGGPGSVAAAGSHPPSAAALDAQGQGANVLLPPVSGPIYPHHHHYHAHSQSGGAQGPSSAGQQPQLQGQQPGNGAAAGGGGLSHHASGIPTSHSGGLPRRLSTGLLDVGGGVSAGAFCDSDLFTPLQPHLSRLWQLWEMVLLARPLLVIGPTPADCSGAVAALVSLITPLPYAPDFRPYYTIHDPAFAALAAGALPGPQQRSVPCLIGCTNLFFVKSLTQWPNVLSVGRKETGNSWAPDQAASQSSAMASMFSAVGAVKALRQRAQGAQALLSGHMEALWSTYKPITRPDQTLLVRLLQPKPGDAKSKLARIAAVNSEALRRHLQELMAAFLQPFGRYFEPGPDGHLPPWDEQEFLFTIRSPATPPPPVLLDRVGGVTANLVELYARFVSCVNFRDWFMLHRRRLAHLEPPAALPASLGGGLAGAAASRTSSPGAGDAGAPGSGLSWFGKASKHLDEVQLINLFFSLEHQLREATAEAEAADADEEAVETRNRLQRELVTLFLGIGQQDLQLLCVSAPSRLELLLAAAQHVCSEEELTGIQQLAAMLQ